jgi:hypothetical protein
MANEDDPEIGQLWRRQPGRCDILPDDVRTKAEAFDAKVQRWNLVGGFTVALLIVKSVGEVVVDTDLIERAGDALLLCALVYVAYRFGRRARAITTPAALGRASCVDYYRARLLHERELSREGWKFVLPFVPGLGLIILGRALEGRPPAQVAALIVVALALLAGVLWVITRRTRAIEREIATIARE